MRAFGGKSPLALLDSPQKLLKINFTTKPVLVRHFSCKLFLSNHEVIT